MAALLSIEDDKDKFINYIDATRELGIEVLPPHINKSGRSFTPSDKKVLFGLSSIKGIGGAKVDKIVEHQPYESIEDMVEKLPKKIFNKTAGEMVIKAGAFSGMGEENRHLLINRFYNARKDPKKIERLDSESFTEDKMIEYEIDALGASLTIKPYWSTKRPNSKIDDSFLIESISERRDRNQNMMAFLELYKKGSTFKGLIFSSTYKKVKGRIKNLEDNEEIRLIGRKDDSGSFIINDVRTTVQPIAFKPNVG